MARSARLKLLNHIAIYLFIRSQFSDLMHRLALLRPASRLCTGWMSNEIFADIWQLPTRLEFIGTELPVWWFHWVCWQLQQEIILFFAFTEVKRHRRLSEFSEEIWLHVEQDISMHPMNMNFNIRVTFTMNIISIIWNFVSILCRFVTTTSSTN